MHNDDVPKLQQLIKQRIARYNDEQILWSTYEAYERAFINHSKLQNQKQLDQILTGSVKYLGLLKEALTKELQASELGGNTRQLTEFLAKLTRDVQNVQAGLKAKAKTI